jgi:hypothetical protein
MPVCHHFQNRSAFAWGKANRRQQCVEEPAAAALLGFATALNPNYTDWRYALAFVVAGRHRRAVAAARAHMRADPFYPPRAALWLGVAYFMLKRYQEAMPYPTGGNIEGP